MLLELHLLIIFSPQSLTFMLKNLAQRLHEELSNLSNSDQLLPKRELHIALQSALAKLDLVTREEFDAQTAVLARTRAKLDALEQTLKPLAK